MEWHSSWGHLAPTRRCSGGTWMLWYRDALLSAKHSTRKVLTLMLLFNYPISLMADGLGDLVINEIQVANIDQYVDPSWNYGAWIEIYNPTGMSRQLRGCWISDDPENLMKSKISQSTIVEAGGYKNLWFDHHDKYCPSQINLKLNQDGGDIFISDSKGRLLFSQEYPPAIPRASWARVNNGADEWGYTNKPTPEASNGDVVVCMERLEAPIVNKPSQIFVGTLPVMVTIPDGCILRYTTDGKTPSMTQGMTSTTGQFIINNTSVYRFALFKEGFLSSPVITRSYLLHDKDFSLPVISVVTDPKNLYSDELGIFVRGVNGRPGLGQSTPCNWNMDWDRPCNFEYLNETGTSLVNQETDMARTGGWSRATTPYAFKIKAKKQYEGKNSLDYPFFQGKPFNKNKCLLMRNGAGGGDSYGRVKDAFLQKLLITSGMDVDAQEYQPVAHYINGLYRGVINMMEPSNKHYVYANYGLDEEDIDFFEIDSDSGYVQKCGTREAFEKWYKLSKTAGNEDTYDKILELVDIDEYCNYMAVEFYLGNWDWMRNNVKAWRPANVNGRFRYVLFDLDLAFTLSTNTFSSFEEKQINTFEKLYGEPVEYWTKEVEPVTIFLNMLQNARFRRQFIDAYCLVAGSVYDPVRCDTLIRKWASYVEPMQLLDDNGYGKNGSPWGEANSVINALSNRQDIMLQTLKNYAPLKIENLEGQRVKLSSNIPEARLLVNGQEIPTGHFNGQLFAPVALSAEAPAGYVFDGWKKTEENISSETLISGGDTWSYYDKGSLDGKNWTSIAYSTSAWKTGRTPLGYGSDNTGFATVMTSNFTTYYFRKVFSLNTPLSDNETILLNYVVDDGFVVYVNGAEAGRYNMPSGNISYNTYSNTYAAVGFDQGVMELNGSLFKKGINNIAVEVHNYSSSSSDICWDANLKKVKKWTPISTEKEMVLPDGDIELMACFSKATTGSSVSTHPVVINEVSATNSIYVNDYYKKSDWVELYNMTDEDIDLAGMYLSDDLGKPAKYKISSNGAEVSTLIPAHGYRIVWCDKRDAITQLHAPFKLANEDYACVLLTAADKSWVDTLIYCAHKGRESVGRFPDGGKNLYWMPRPTIKKSNAWSSNNERWDGMSIIIDKINLLVAESGAMNITFRNNTLYIRSEEKSNVTLQIYTLNGTLVMSYSLRMDNEKKHVNLSSLPTGTYIANTSDQEGNKCAIKVLIK